jgi:hypothetical protein
VWTLRFSGGTPVISLPSAKWCRRWRSNPRSCAAGWSCHNPRPEKAEKLTRLDTETDVVYGDEIAETLSDIADLQKRHRPARDKARILARMDDDRPSPAESSGAGARIDQRLRRVGLGSKPANWEAGPRRMWAQRHHGCAAFDARLILTRLLETSSHLLP